MKIIKNLLCVCLAGMAGLSGIQAQDRTSVTEIYVSPEGSDTNIGSKKQPMATLEAAWKKASAVAGKLPVTVYLREGIYYLKAPIEIGKNQSGTKECPVVFTGYRDEKAVISTARVWKDLTWTSYRDGIMKAQVDLGEHPDQLFVNGKLQRMARYPNYNPDEPILNGYAEDALSPQRAASWKNPAGGYVHAIHSREWGGYHYEITGKDAQGELQLKGGFQNNRPMGMHKKFRMVENIFEELDAPGEWYYDGGTHILYYYPLKGMDLDKACIEVPGLESAFVLKGTKERPVTDVHVRYLAITQTLRTFMKTDEPLLRSDWCIYRGGAVLLENAERCSIENCDLYDLGGNAVFLSGKNKGVNIYANHIYNVGGSGVCCVGSPKAVRSPLFAYTAPFVPYEAMDQGNGPLTDDYPFECTIDNNLIHHIGRVEKQVAGVQLSMSRRITVSHNSIYHVPRAGINVSEGTWGGYIIEGNDVFNTVLETGDHGAFNSWGRDRFWSASWGKMTAFLKEHKEMVKADVIETNILRGNRFQCSHGWDIDLDDGSSNYHIYNNLCLSGGLKLREGFYRTVENNVIINNSFHPHVWFEGSEDVFRHNIVTTTYRPIGVQHWGKEVDYNFFIDPQGLQEARKRGTDAHSLSGDPLFVNPKQGDYRVKKHSLALQVQFKNFDMNSFGVQVSRLKELADKPNVPVLRSGKDFLQQKEQVHTWRGLQVKNVTSEGERSATGLDAVRGVWILDVGKGEKDFKKGDVIIRFHGKTVYTWDNIQSEIGRCRTGETVSVTVLREQQERRIQIKF